MITVYVTYEGAPDARFDRDYWLNHHFPLVRRSWGPLGLEELWAFFPGQEDTKVVAIALCLFRDEASLLAAFAPSASREVMDDVKRFTDILPQQTRAEPLKRVV